MSQGSCVHIQEEPCFYHGIQLRSTKTARIGMGSIRLNFAQETSWTLPAEDRIRDGCAQIMGQTRFVDPITLVAYCPRAYHGLTGGFLLLRHFSVAIFVSPHVCFI